MQDPAISGPFGTDHSDTLRFPPGLGPAGHDEPQSAPATGAAEVKKDQQGGQFCAATSAKEVPKEKPQ